MVDLKLADRIVKFLNELVKVDVKAIEALIDSRVPCNEAMGDHPTVQVGAKKDSGELQVGLLGILNGLCGVYREGPRKHHGPITAWYTPEGVLKRFYLGHEYDKLVKTGKLKSVASDPGYTRMPKTGRKKAEG